jgi:hypothetical protein
MRGEEAGIGYQGVKTRNFGDAPGVIEEGMLPSQ